MPPQEHFFDDSVITQQYFRTKNPMPENKGIFGGALQSTLKKSK